MTELAKIEQTDAVQHHGTDQQDGGLMSVIKAMATDDRFDVDKMKAILEMRADEEERIRRIEREDREDDARRAWLRAFSSVQSEIGPIVRNRKNTHTQSQYADLAEIERIVTPILTKNGFSTTCVPVPCSENGCIRMRLTIGHSDGHEKSYEDDFPIDAAGSAGKVNKTPIQAKGSTQSYARRYLKASALDLSFTDDNDGNSPKNTDPTISADQFLELKDMIERAGLTDQIVCQAEGVQSLEALPASKFNAVKSNLQANIKKREQAQ